MSKLKCSSAGWWLRSPGNTSSNAASVSDGGSVYADGIYVYYTLAVRPAFNLNLSSVIFTSAASVASGKNSVNVGSTLSAATALTGAVKFTVLDSSLNLASVTPTGVDGREITFDYTGATADKTLSAVVKDSAGVVKYYGKLAHLTAQTGSDAVTVPDDFAATDTLEIFVEEINGDNLTDFAGGSKTITVAAQTPPTSLTGVACTTSANNNGKITGTTTAMEYSTDGGATWADCTATETTGLASGSYQVRYAGKVEGTTAHLASKSVPVTVGAYSAPTTKTPVTIDGDDVASVSTTGNKVTITWKDTNKKNSEYDLSKFSVTVTYGEIQFTVTLTTAGDLVVTGDGALLPDGTIVVLTATESATTQAQSRAASLRRGAAYALGEAKAAIIGGKCVFTFPAEQVSKLPAGTYDLTFSTKGGANPAFKGTFAKGYVHVVSEPAAPEILLDASETASGGDVQVSATVISGDVPQAGVTVQFTLRNRDNTHLTSLSRVTNASGTVPAFVLDTGLTNGTYTVTVSATGYATVSKIVTVTNGETGGGDGGGEEEEGHWSGGGGGCDAGAFGLLTLAIGAAVVKKKGVLG